MWNYFIDYDNYLFYFLGEEEFLEMDYSKFGSFLKRGVIENSEELKNVGVFVCLCFWNLWKLEILFEVEEEVFDGYGSMKFLIEDFI